MSAFPLWLGAQWCISAPSAWEQLRDRLQAHTRISNRAVDVVSGFSPGRETREQNIHVKKQKTTSVAFQNTHLHWPLIATEGGKELQMTYIEKREESTKTCKPLALLVLHCLGEKCSDLLRIPVANWCCTILIRGSAWGYATVPGQLKERITRLGEAAICLQRTWQTVTTLHPTARMREGARQATGYEINDKERRSRVWYTWGTQKVAQSWAKGKETSGRTIEEGEALNRWRKWRGEIVRQNLRQITEGRSWE